MGSCTSLSAKVVEHRSSSPAKPADKPSASKGPAFDEREAACLKLIYQDLVSRTRDGELSSNVFEVFFHMSHVFGGSLFRKFTGSNARISEQTFVSSVLGKFKEGLEEKIKFMFSLYNLSESQGLSFNELLAILLSSPQQEIKQVLSKDQFLESLKVEQMAYFVMDSKKIDEKVQEREYKCNLSLFPYIPSRKQSFHSENDPYLSLDSLRSCQTNICLQDIIVEQNTARQQRSSKEENSFDEKENCQKSLIKTELKKNINRSIYTTEILRRYAEYLFKKLGLDKETDELSLEQFRNIVVEHPKIYKQCYEGFHQYLWLHEDGVPQYRKIEPAVQGFCEEVSEQNPRRRVFLANIKNSLLVFSDHTKENLLAIKNLQGLVVEPLDMGQTYGFMLKHQDCFYPEMKYLFPTSQQQAKWLEVLVEFQEKDVFRKYKLEQKIGQGSFCEVFRCVNNQTGEQRAIKIIDKNIRSPDEILAVNSESQMLATCAMEGVVRAYERFQTKTHIYLILQLIEQGTLYHYVRQKQQKRCTQSEARIIMRSLLTIVYHLHELGIIHRDLKLQNILMKEQNGKSVPKLIDFGMAVYEVQLNNLPKKRKYVGTPNFAAPEIYRNQQYDETIDIFSLGVILHFLLTGTLPFHSICTQEVEELTLDCHINYKSKNWKQISFNCKDLLSRMICLKENRSCAEELLSHPWFNGQES